MSYQYVNVVTINKVAVIEFNYGRKLNALSKVFIDDLMQALSDLNRPEIRCIILRAPSGSKVFSAGHDIHELPSGGRDPLSYDDPLRQITRMIQKFPKPIISMVEGSVWGGAFEMIMSSDLIIAASTSTFSMSRGDFVAVRDADHGVGAVSVDHILNGISDQFARWQ